MLGDEMQEGGKFGVAFLRRTWRAGKSFCSTEKLGRDFSSQSWQHVARVQENSVSLVTLVLRRMWNSVRAGMSFSMTEKLGFSLPTFGRHNAWRGDLIKRRSSRSLVLRRT